MLYTGKQITSAADALSKVPLDYLYHSIKNPKEEIQAKLRQLRIIRDIDKKRYGLLKKELPYLVCGVFNPPFRRTENFAYIEYFIIDIDHISQKGLSIKEVRHEIEQDSQTLMCFLSPGEDGLKVLLKLNDRCYDSGLYSIFYKIFVRQFSEHYHLEQVIDTQTCDVSRACFISSDPNVYYNPEAESVEWKTFVDENNPLELFDTKHKEEKYVKDALTAKAEMPDEKDKDPDGDAIRRIKEILQLKSHPAEKTPAYVPEQLNEIIEDVQKHIEETGIQVTEIINISYGKKIRMKLGVKQAEINLFYGKKGFTVVQSPRCGVNMELNSLAADLIHNFLLE